MVIKTKNAGILGAVLTAALFAGQAQAASTSGDASVDVVAPISVSQVTALSFGSVTASASSGTVTVDTSGTRTVGGGVSTLGGTVAAGSFSVSGTGSNAYSISLPSDGTVSLTGTGSDIPVTGFNHNAGGSPALSGGSDTFNVGATLSIGASQTAGTYTGTYTVTVNYQ